MAEKDFEADDPMEFVAMRYKIPAGVDGDAVTRRCFIEEYALIGMPRNRVMQLFRSAHFAATHAIYESRGERFVADLIDQVYGPVPCEEGV